MTCYELTYQVRVHRLCVSLRLRGWPADELDMLCEHVLYESEAALTAWEAVLRWPATPNPDTPKG